MQARRCDFLEAELEVSDFRRVSIKNNFFLYRFASDRLHFGKVDVGRYAEQAQKEFVINTAFTSRQLPTVALFRGGKEVMRRPRVFKGRAQPYIYSEVLFSQCGFFF